MAKGVNNVAASVRQRLRNLSLDRQRDFGLVLVNYGLERLIYRLSISPHHNSFVLKGGMLVSIWTADDNRTTRDADFLGFGELDEVRLKSTFAEIMGIEAEDGLVFNTANLSARVIREDNIYGGVRLKTVALLDNSRIPITIDIGLGDALTEPEHRIDYPSLLGQPIAKVRAYPPTTVIAEKFQAIVALGAVNGRMKDYYDLWAIPNAIPIDAAALDAAIADTFARRKSAIPMAAPVGLTTAFSSDPQKANQWKAYAESVGVEETSLAEVIAEIWTYLGPSCQRLGLKKQE
jgi:Nucleotidyl transferase AbiEii toxin, Type IV TA system